MKILHLASFSGNIGDGANHRGFYRMFKHYVDPSAVFYSCEIRDFYRSWGIRKFDEQFVEEVNSYDMLLIGGGNFFEICWDYSQTGCTIDFSDEVIDAIDIPILIVGMGFDDTKGYSDQTEKRFEDFLEKLIAKNAKLLFRNDGSIELLKNHYDDSLISQVSEIPDGGFFYKIREPQTVFEKTVSFCIAQDMSELRYKGGNHEGFSSDLACWCNDFFRAHREYKIIFVPHIYSDLSIINEVVQGISDQNRRLNVLIAPLFATSPSLIDPTFSSYYGTSLVVSMRFHGNVVPLGNSIPTLGISSLPKHKLLYENLGLGDRYLSSTSDDFWAKFDSMVSDSISRQESIVKRYSVIQKRVIQNEIKQLNDIKSWIINW